MTEFEFDINDPWLYYEPPHGTDYLSTLPLEKAAELIQEDYELHFNCEFLNNDCPKDLLDKLKAGILLTNQEVETLFELDRKAAEEWCKKLEEERRQEVIDNLDTLYDKLMDMFEKDLITLEDDEVWAVQEAIRILKEDDE